jgi:hypothetical protein
MRGRIMNEKATAYVLTSKPGSELPLYWCVMHGDMFAQGHAKELEHCIELAEMKAFELGASEVEFRYQQR